MYNIGNILELAAAKYPRRQALVYRPKSQFWTYDQWDGHVNRLANALLKLGINKGDTISTYLGNCSELVSVLFAAAKIGAVFNPINCNLSSGELSFILNDAQAKLLVFGSTGNKRVTGSLARIKTVQHYLYVDGSPPGFARSYYQLCASQSAIKPVVEVSENDWFSIIYTSGTTGKPKGVIHKHRDIVDHSMCMIQSQKLSYQDRGLSVDPLYHAAELHCFFLPRVHVGAASIIADSSDPKLILQLLEEEKITFMFADPAICRLIIQNAPEGCCLPSLRLLANGGAPMPHALAAKCREIFKTDILHLYGMTEMGPAITVLYPEELEAKAGSVGKPLINHQIRVVRLNAVYPSDPDDILAPGEKGEVVVQGVGMMQGYYNRPELTAEAMYGGWYHTGDIGCFDSEGYLWLSGRRDDVIFSGVENVYPEEIEEVLLDHPDVVETAVVGVEKREWETEIVAFIVSRNKLLAAAEVNSFLKESEKLADFKIPGEYRLVDKLPRVTTGKIQRRQLIKKIKK
ncbi:fatty-acyl-CoA synthase [Desulfotomaculum arcticum]|uniref:Fatty-acyl-CoA synthase n=1 Tax=Desulfotruncus arcticus DSM 17038 TaxID=1121424 RepID=A0A1I2XZZ2_9FIRM|nr:long-chain-fatty-acid--CoA ligase [Desulfotruncus arcticus]SFH19068.1 fatty-acyl-CoA synthase [Desulfotomaculum arcticum] [Desulfotruncus arcticus DSM 17038]